MAKYLTIFLLAISCLLSSCEEEFLDKQPPIGLTDDKLTDMASMQALIYGAYGQIRPFVHQPALYGAGMMRDVLNRARGEYDQFYDHEVTQNMTSWMYSAGYGALSALNTVAITNLDEIDGSDVQKDAILGDMHFLRALIYFELNNYFTLPSTGYSVPLLLAPISTDDQVETATSVEVRAQIEADIENARLYFQNTSGESDYWAATALAARIYFYHGKYDLAYERSNEVITSGSFSMDDDVTGPFQPGSSSPENIFTFKFNNVDGTGTSPTSRIWEAYQADPLNGFYSVNPNSIDAGLFLDNNDARYNAFYTEDAQFIFMSGKYPTEQMDYRYIRLAEMHLTRAESNVMISNSVSQQDIDDVNIVRGRAMPEEMLSVPISTNQILEELYVERTKELAFELGDHFLNTKRLQRGISKISSEGSGIKSFEEYDELLVFPFPQIEIDVHNLTRRR